MTQNGLTIITPVLPGNIELLLELLNDTGKNIGKRADFDFESCTSVHFMRWVYLPPQESSSVHAGPQLVLSTNFDGDEQDHLKEIVTVMYQGFLKIYSHCHGFPAGLPASDEIVDYLLRFKVKNAAFYVGHVGRTVIQIKQEYALRQAVQSFLQTDNPSQNWAGKSSESIRAHILSNFREMPFFQWAFKKYKPPFLYRFGKVVSTIGLIAFLSALVCGFVMIPVITGTLFLALLLGISLWFRQLGIHEKRDSAKFVPSPRDPHRIASLNEREDFRIQNQITHLVEIKPGKFRLGTLKFILGAINLLATTFFNKGNLGGIPSIHFARWAIIDNGRRLLFFSNFDGSWESYLGDFIDKAAIGLTAVWSNTVGFPPTRKLIYAGARNSADFKAWVRMQQLETQVWYSAYKTLTVQNINNNTAIREGMTGKMNENASSEWLQKL